MTNTQRKEDLERKTIVEWLGRRSLFETMGDGAAVIFGVGGIYRLVYGIKTNDTAQTSKGAGQLFAAGAYAVGKYFGYRKAREEQELKNNSA